MTWTATELVTGVSGLPSPAAIAAVGSNPSVVYFGPGPGYGPMEQDRTSSWQAASPLGSASSYAASPSLVAMSGGSADLLTVYLAQDTANGTGALTFNTRSSGTWSGAATIAGALAPESTTFGPDARVALAALPGGKAIAAWSTAPPSGSCPRRTTARAGRPPRGSGHQRPDARRRPGAGARRRGKDGRDCVRRRKRERVARALRRQHMVEPPSGPFRREPRRPRLFPLKRV